MVKKVLRVTRNVTDRWMARRTDGRTLVTLTYWLHIAHIWQYWFLHYSFDPPVLEIIVKPPINQRSPLFTD